MNAFLFTLAASLAALVGGWVAFKGRKNLNLALGFTAGLILGLVAFELLPEIFNLTNTTLLTVKWPMLALVVGFLFMHIVEKSILIHGGQESDYGPHSHPYVGTVSALALCGHSFLDGMTVGLSFQVNYTVGTAVAFAVIGHRFADGFNTTNVMLRHGNRQDRAKLMLLIAAVMPLLGLIATYFFSPATKFLAIYLGFFAGFLLYIGASDVLPQAHSKNSSSWTVAATVAGAIFMLGISHLA